jgi:DNA polymerase-1
VEAWLEQSKAEAQLVMQVHDELVLEVTDSAVEKVRARIVEIMCGAGELSVALKVDTGIGPNWDAAH